MPYVLAGTYDHIIVHQTIHTNVCTCIEQIEMYILHVHVYSCVYTLRPLAQDAGSGVWPASPTVSQPLGPS